MTTLLIPGCLSWRRLSFAILLICANVGLTVSTMMMSISSFLRQEYLPGEDILRHFVLVERDLVLVLVETGVARLSILTPLEPEGMGWEWGIDEAADNDIDLLLAPSFLLSESRMEDWSSAVPEPEKRDSSCRGKVEGAYWGGQFSDNGD